VLTVLLHYDMEAVLLKRRLAFFS